MNINIRPFYVAPVLPEKLKHLEDIAMNLWYSWNWEAVRLFIMIDREVWERSQQNPVAMLGRVPHSRLQELAQDDGFVANVERVYSNLQSYLDSSKWFEQSYKEKDKLRVAYFSCEFGLDEGLPVYSGGLGVLAGDHLKTASDLGIPLVGIGLLYRQGYFRQRLNSDGWQLEEYPENDWYNMPVSLKRDENGDPVILKLQLRDMLVQAQIWFVQVGAIELYLLDTNFEANPPEVREITTQLYGGDRDMRLRQELLLGIGGIRMLRLLGIEPTVYHINEGHSAFQILERIALMIEEHGMSYDEAREFVWATNVFTTHTPVPAGNEQFQPDLLKKYLEPTVQRMKISWEEFLSLGRVNPEDQNELFGLTVFALRHSAFNNGVSKLHGEVSRDMWKDVWKGIRSAHEVPITHVTNGIHSRSYLSHELLELFESYLGPRFAQKPWEFDIWKKVDSIPDIEIWRTQQRRREKLVFFARQRLHEQIKRRGGQPSELAAAEEVLSPHALTIGFARRFATYKRANLLFSDLERLKRIVRNTDRPIQFIMSGKAHPQDQPAKELIRRIIHIIREETFRCSFVFIEDYDINVARYLVQGCDVWLNTPRRPFEASGTSGMKVSTNGGLNLSILDGWWDEGYDPMYGWAISNLSQYSSPENQDVIEAQALYDCLENEVIPLFYDRDNSDLPRRWIARMKASMRDLGPFFSTHRMLQEYTENLYVHAHDACDSYAQKEFDVAKRVASWRKFIDEHWHEVAIEKVESTVGNSSMHVGDSLNVTIQVRLDQIKPENVVVEVISGRLDSKDHLCEEHVYPARLESSAANNAYTFVAEIPCVESGRHGYAIRVRPYNPELIRNYSTDHALWG